MLTAKFRSWFGVLANKYVFSGLFEFLRVSGVCVWLSSAVMGRYMFMVSLFQAPQSLQCGVCLQIVRRDSLLALPCQHSFCKGCWEQHCTVLVKDGLGVGEQKVCACVSLCICVVVKAYIRVGEWSFCELPNVCLCICRPVLVYVLVCVFLFLLFVSWSVQSHHSFNF